MEKNFRPDIEGLRAIAILTVVAFHAGVPGFGGGFVGVDVFFVLSGYLITGLLVKEMESKGSISLTAFYARRARRLLPASALALLVTVIATYVIYSPVEQNGIPQTAIATAAYVSNLFFARAATDYFRAGAETNPLLHTWSLGVEEQFYLAWPLMVLVALRKGGRPLLLKLMIAVAVLSFALSVWLTWVRQPWAFFSSPTRAWEFALGALGVLLPGLRSERVGRVVGWLGLLMILAASALFHANTPYPGWASLLPVLGTVAVLRSGTSTPAGKLLSTPVLQFFGRLSYSWYLWHWPVLVLAGALLGGVSLPVRLGLAALSLGLALISYKLVENPIRFHPLLVRRSAYALLMAAGLTLFGIGSAIIFGQLSKRAAAAPAQARFTRARNDIPVVYQDQCITLAFGSELRDCVYGQKDSSKTMVLFGDSYAAQWFPAVNRIAESEGWRLVTLFKVACAPVEAEYIYPKIGRRYTECENWRAAALKRIEELRPAMVIVTASALYLGDKPLISPSAWLDGLRRSLTALQNSGARVVYLRGTPAPTIDVVACLARSSWQSGWRPVSPCTFERAAGMNDRVADEERRVAEAAHASYIDMTEYICPGATCQPEREGQVIYQEGGHLTGDFINGLMPALKERLEEASR